MFLKPSRVRPSSKTKLPKSCQPILLSAHPARTPHTHHTVWRLLLPLFHFTVINSGAMTMRMSTIESFLLYPVIMHVTGS